MGNKYIVGFLVVGGLVLAPAVGAANFVTGEEVTLSDNVVNDDLFIAGNGVVVDKNVDEDVFAGGQSVRVDANVGGDVYAGGNTVQIRGVVGDDVGAAGELVEISATSVDDVYAVGNRVEISSDTVVAGSVFSCGGSVVMAGTVKQDVRACGENIVIKSGAVIEGDLLTYGKKGPVIEEGAKVLGSTKHRLQEVKAGERASIARWVGGVLAWFVAGLVLTYLWPGFTRKVTGIGMKKAMKSLGLGLLWLLLIVPVWVLLLVTVVGIPLAMMLVFLTVWLVMLAIVYATIIVGVWLMNKLSRGETGEVKWQHVLLGVMVYKLVGLVPLVGGWLVFLTTLLALGAVVISFWQLLRGFTTDAVAS